MLWTRPFLHAIVEWNHLINFEKKINRKENTCQPNDRSGFDEELDLEGTILENIR